MGEGYTVGGDTLYTIEPPAIIGQTFSPLQAHQLEYIDVNAKKITLGGKLSATLYDLDDDPNMFGGGIAHSKYENWPPRWWWELSRIRFVMSKAILEVGKTYGILIQSEPSPWWNKHKIQYDADDATYPRGMRFTKASLTDPPTFYPNDDLMFVEFGEPPPPPPVPEPPGPPPPIPPGPPVDHWIIRDIYQQKTLAGYLIYATTDVPCHLYKRWSTTKPRFHKIPHIKRGETLFCDVRFCFVVYEDEEQTEPGDTILHTFRQEPWPICETRWFIFWGTVFGEEMPSTSGLFTKHLKTRPPQTITLYPARSFVTMTSGKSGGHIGTNLLDTYHKYRNNYKQAEGFTYCFPAIVWSWSAYWDIYLLYITRNSYAFDIPSLGKIKIHSALLRYDLRQTPPGSPSQDVIYTDFNVILRHVSPFQTYFSEDKKWISNTAANWALALGYETLASHPCASLPLPPQPRDYKELDVTAQVKSQELFCLSLLNSEDLAGIFSHSDDYAWSRAQSALCGVDVSLELKYTSLE